MKIFIDICNAAKIMLLGKGSSLAVGRGRGFISKIKSSARVESLGTALASTTAKPAWSRGKASSSMYIVSSWGGKKKKRSKSIPVVHSSSPVHRLLTALHPFVTAK